MKKTIDKRRIFRSPGTRPIFSRIATVFVRLIFRPYPITNTSATCKRTGGSVPATTPISYLATPEQELLEKITSSAAAIPSNWHPPCAFDSLSLAKPYALQPERARGERQATLGYAFALSAPPPSVGHPVLGSRSFLHIGEDRPRREDHIIGKDFWSYSRDALEPASSVERQWSYKPLVHNRKPGLDY